MRIIYNSQTGIIEQTSTFACEPGACQDFVDIPGQQPSLKFHELYQIDLETKTLIDRSDLVQRQQQQRLQNIRNRRNQLLANSDWTQVADAAVSDSKRSAWQAYRQALRDITDTLPDPIPENYRPLWPPQP